MSFEHVLASISYPMQIRKFLSLQKTLVCLFADQTPSTQGVEVFSTPKIHKDFMKFLVLALQTVRDSFIKVNLKTVFWDKRPFEVTKEQIFSISEGFCRIIDENCFLFFYWGHKCAPGSLAEQSLDCCTIENPCPKNVGGCTYDEQCEKFLACNQYRKGIEFGYNINVHLCGESIFFQFVRYSEYVIVVNMSLFFTRMTVE